MIPQVFAQSSTASTSPAKGMGFGATMVPMVVVMLIFYFLLLRPQRKREVEHKKLLEGLKKGDEIITQSGLIGRISSIEGAIVLCTIAPNVTVRISKASIAGLLDETANAQTSAKA